MSGKRTIPGILFFICLIGWALVFYTMFLLPRQVAVWEEAGTALPVITVLMINVGQACHKFGLVIVPLLGLTTVGSLIWFVIAGGRGK